MSTHVYANGDEISCKASSGKTSVAFPDPCWTPPTPPAGPLLVTYPNSASPSSLAKGSSTVRIKRSPIALTDRSYFSTSTGDEPATPALQKGLLTRKIKGKTYYNQWSMNVKVEGKGVCRNIDLMTHNHGSKPGNTATFPFLSKAIVAGSDGDPCKHERNKINTTCAEGVEKGQDWTDQHCSDGLLQIKPVTTSAENSKGNENDPLTVLSTALESVNLDREAFTSLDDFANAQTRSAKENDCLSAKKCELVTKTKANGDKSKNGHSKGCCNGQTGHHVVPHAMAKTAECKKYGYGSAPCICVEGTTHSRGSHKEMHEAFGSRMREAVVDKMLATGKDLDLITLSMDEAIDVGAQSVIDTFSSNSGCSKSCIQEQLKSYYKECKNEMGPVGNTANEFTQNEKSDIIKIVAQKVQQRANQTSMSI